MKHFFTLTAFVLVFATTANSQSGSYFTSSIDMIFSFANIDDNGKDGDNLMRWVPVINMGSYINSDLSEKFGIYAGLSVQNVGYIYDNYVDPTTQNVYKKKFRSYNLGIPVGLKFGDLSNLYFFGGYEIEFPFVYKEKTYDGGDKINKTTGWFSDRQEAFQHGFFAGIHLPDGGTIKFKYYLSEFHNEDFTDGSGNKPYAGLKSNIFYFTLGYLLYRE